MTIAGLKRPSFSYFVFAQNLETDKVIICIVYIYEFFFFGHDIGEINSIKGFLLEMSKINNLRSYDQFTRIEIEYQIEEKIIFFLKTLMLRILFNI